MAKTLSIPTTFIIWSLTRNPEEVQVDIIPSKDFDMSRYQDDTISVDHLLLDEPVTACNLLQRVAKGPIGFGLHIHPGVDEAQVGKFVVAVARTEMSLYLTKE